MLSIISLQWQFPIRCSILNLPPPIKYNYDLWARFNGGELSNQHITQIGAMTFFFMYDLLWNENITVLFLYTSDCPKMAFS